MSASSLASEWPRSAAAIHEPGYRAGASSIALWSIASGTASAAAGTPSKKASGRDGFSGSGGCRRNASAPDCFLPPSEAAAAAKSAVLPLRVQHRGLSVGEHVSDVDAVHVDLRELDLGVLAPLAGHDLQDCVPHAGRRGRGAAGALLITLPAPSLPSVALVGSALSCRITLATAAMVAAAALLAGPLLWLLT